MARTPESIYAYERSIKKGAEDNAKGFLQVVYFIDPSISNFSPSQAEYAGARLIERGLGYLSVNKIRRALKEHYLTGAYARAYIGGASFEDIAEIENRDPIEVSSRVNKLAYQISYLPVQVIPDDPRELLDWQPSFVYSPPRWRELLPTSPDPPEVKKELPQMKQSDETNNVPVTDFLISSKRHLVPSHEEGYFTPGEETELVNWVRTGIFIHAVQNGFVQTSVAFSESEADILLFLGDSAQQRLVQEHRHIVEEIARSFIGRGASYEDLQAIGNIGLLKAIINWNEMESARLHGYIREKVKGEIRNSLRYNYRPVKIPKTLHGTLFEFWRTRETLTQALNRQPTQLEYESALGLGQKEVLELQHASRSLSRPLSLDTTPNEYNDAEESNLLRWLSSARESMSEAVLLQWLGVPQSVSEESYTRRKTKKKAVAALLKIADLNPREITVACFQFGLTLPEQNIAYGPMPAAIIAQELDISYKRVWAIEKELRAKILAAMEFWIGSVDEQSYDQLLTKLASLELSSH